MQCGTELRPASEASLMPALEPEATRVAASSPAAASEGVLSWRHGLSALRLARLAAAMAAVVLLSVYTLSARGSDSTARPPTPTAPGGGVSSVVDAPATPSLTPAASPAASPAATSAVTSAVTPVPSQRVATPTPEPPAPTADSASTPSPSAPALPATVVLEGSASQTAPFSHPGGSVRVLSEATSPSASGCVYTGTLQAVPPTVLPYDPSLTTTVVWIEGAGSGSGWVDLDLAAGAYQMAIESDCTWRVTIALR